MKKIVLSLFAFVFILISFAPACSQQKDIASQNQINTADTVIISLRRSPCYGYCANYLVEIYRSGKVIYTGIGNVVRIGTYKSSVSKEVIEKIRKKAMEVKFFEMADVYPVETNFSVSDNPTYTTFLNFDGRQKTVRNNYLPPKELTELENFIDEMTKDLEWQKQQDNK